jgi:Zn finger protein HypA/HybF involved in hydrogenase expression
MESRYEREATWFDYAKRDAACVNCGNIVSLSAPDLRPYSCAHCHGKFEYVDEMVLAVA